MDLFDTHFHFYGDSTPDYYYKKAENSDVKYLLAAGADLDSSFLAKQFSSEIETAWYSVGTHPHEASKHIDGISVFEQFRNGDKLVAVGEIGLDYFYENSDRKSQLQVFESFLKMALDWELPAIIHCRDKDASDSAYSDAFTLLSDFAKDNGKFVVHCFTGTTDWAEKFLELDAYLGITGIVTFPRAQNVRDVLKVIPDNRLLIETDTPYLAPVPYRGKTNHSAYLKEIAEYVATERNRSYEEIANLTTQNGFNLFNIN